MRRSLNEQKSLNPLTPIVAMGTAMKHPMPDRVKRSFVIFNIRALWRSLSLYRQSAKMSKITKYSYLFSQYAGVMVFLYTEQLYACKL